MWTPICLQSLHCLLNNSNIQDRKFMWLIHTICLFFTCVRKLKPHMGELNHPSCWCNAYLLIDLHKSIWTNEVCPLIFNFEGGDVFMIPHQRNATWPSVLFCYSLIRPGQNWSLDSTSLLPASRWIFWLILLLSNKHTAELITWLYSSLPAFRWVFSSVTSPVPILLNISMNIQIQSDVLPAAAVAAWSKYRKAKLWVMTKSKRRTSVINKNQLMKSSKTYLQGIERFLLSGFFSCLLRKGIQKKTDRTKHVIGNSCLFHSYALAPSLPLLLHREGDKPKQFTLRMSKIVCQPATQPGLWFTILEALQARTWLHLIKN